MKLVKRVVNIKEVLTYETSIENIVARQTIVDGIASSFTLELVNNPEYVGYTTWVAIRTNTNDNPCTYSEFLRSCRFEFSEFPVLVPENVFLFYNDGQVIFDHNWNTIPCIHEFDYIGTPFHDGCLDLEKAIGVLKNHPWVVNKNDLKIEDIPYYNREEDFSKTIRVSILPDKDTYNKLYQKVKNQRDWSTRLRELLHDGHCPDEEHNLLGLLECVK